MRRILLFLPILLTGFFLPGFASAQIIVDLKLDRSLYVSHEPITGDLTITNRAGQDLIFGDSGGMSWLDFTVTTGHGHLVTPAHGHAAERPIVLSAGQTHTQKVTINRRYPMATIGTYRVKASVTFPQINRVFETKTVSVQVTDGQAMWSQIVGVPPGHPQAGTYREFALMTFYHGARAKSLYFRLRDSDSGMVFRTFPIGDYMSLRPPTYLIDPSNNLHVLHMNGPQSYKYTVINIDGAPVQQKTVFENESSRPSLKADAYGEVTVVGGISETEATTPYEQVQFRRLSERPPGLPSP